MIHRELFLLYLSHYASRDIGHVAAMLAENVLLRDWKISVRGKEAVIHETRRNFQSSTNIDIETLRLYSSESAVIGELKITIDDSDPLYVTDIIHFDEDGKIQSIRAYIGRSD
ncbi:nuclear transport factor 2 family protein [uncultured Gilvimarinus sp.]|uniref:nuclear transport factor 2 family protein n=1 Tax=uncultured Gilvimarinus sp. TaxID=1689143 RepID=UPI0030EF507E